MNVNRNIIKCMFTKHDYSINGIDNLFHRRILICSRCGYETINPEDTIDMPIQMQLALLLGLLYLVITVIGIISIVSNIGR